MKRFIALTVVVITITILGVVSFPSNKYVKLIEHLAHGKMEYITVKNSIIGEAQDMERCTKIINQLEAELIVIIKFHQSNNLTITQDELEKIGSRAIPILKGVCK
jgi:hypothetical protein